MLEHPAGLKRHRDGSTRRGRQHTSRQVARSRFVPSELLPASALSSLANESFAMAEKRAGHLQGEPHAKPAEPTITRSPPISRPHRRTVIRDMCTAIALFLLAMWNCSLVRAEVSDNSNASSQLDSAACRAQRNIVYLSPDGATISDACPDWSAAGQKSSYRSYANDKSGSSPSGRYRTRARRNPPKRYSVNTQDRKPKYDASRHSSGFRRLRRQILPPPSTHPLTYIPGAFTRDAAAAACGAGMQLAAIDAYNWGQATTMTGGSGAWIGSWNTDNYMGTCIALYSINSINVPPQGCAQPLGALCEPAGPKPPAPPPPPPPPKPPAKPPKKPKKCKGPKCK